MKFDVISIGGATEDLTFYTQEGVVIDNHQDLLKQKLLAFEYGAKIKIDRSFSNFGGGAANAAVCLSLLGFKTAACVAVGNDERGKAIINNFKKRKVNISLIRKNQEETGFSFLLTGQGNEHIVFSSRGANSLLALDKTALDQLAKVEWLYITSLSGDWRNVLDDIFSVSGPLIAWNPGHIQLKAGIGVLRKHLAQTEILLINKDEALELASSDMKNRDKSEIIMNSVRNLLVIIKKYGPRIVVITNGRFGADAYDGKEFYHQDILTEKKKIDTTGVGDAFGSTFVAGISLFSGDIARALYLGAKNTASLIGEQGAQNGLLAKSEIMRGIKK
jgi:sugar/nucleoside kinase (ribokinase family)